MVFDGDDLCLDELGECRMPKYVLRNEVLETLFNILKPLPLGERNGITLFTVCRLAASFLVRESP